MQVENCIIAPRATIIDTYRLRKGLMDFSKLKDNIIMIEQYSYLPNFTWSYGDPYQS